MNIPHSRSALVLCIMFFFSSFDTFSSNASVYSVAFTDPSALDMAEDGPFQISPNSDITKTLQNAIDHVANSSVFGVILIPSGNYHISDTLFVWKGIRLIGYGNSRPTFILPANTPGYAESEPKYLLHFASNKPETGKPFRDANPGTFYSALSNIDFRLENGNASAVAVRSHWAQHGYISHVRFNIGDALAGVDEVGNIIHDCEFIGGDYGIMTRKPSPSWPFALLDSEFTKQKKASILTQEAGLTIVRCEFKDTPFAVLISEQRSEELVMDQCRFESVSEAITLISEASNARTQINIIQCNAINSPVIAKFRNARKPTKGLGLEPYSIDHFSHGLHLSDGSPLPTFETRVGLSPLANSSTPYLNPERQLPDNSKWTNVATLGAIGDGEFDNTEILRKAIAEHEFLYFPTGRYRVTDTLTLKSHTCLIGLSPITTQILIQDECTAFHPAGPPKAVIESAEGGQNILQGIGIDAAAINHRAVALKWMGSESSVVSDVRFLGGHGTYDSDGNYLDIYNSNRSGDPDIYRRWGSMPASLWVTNNGGGSFKNLWTPSPYAHAGMLIEDTSTPGYCYQISSEHHLRNEFILRDVHNWKFYAIQFEEEMWEGRNTLPMQILKSSNLSFHNTYIYRVMRTFTPFPYGIEVSSSENIHFHGIHAYGPSKFTVDDTLHIQDTKTGIRSREIAYLEINSTEQFRLEPEEPTFELLADGFNHIDSPELDSLGNLYFVDQKNQRIWRWNPSISRTELVLDIPIEPSQIVLEDDHTLIILTRTGKVYSKNLKTGNGYQGLDIIEKSDALASGRRKIVIPSTRWRDSHDFIEVNQATKPFFYNSRLLTIPSEASFSEAKVYTSWFRTIDLLRTYDLTTVEPGDSVFVSDEFAQKTWKFILQANGSLSDPILFAEEGEAGVQLDRESERVYIAAGHLFVYDTNGELKHTLTPPERPTAIMLDSDSKRGKKLYILARSRLFVLQL